jgi:hypothetical protein
MSVSKPIGRNSVVTIEKVPTAIEPTASQAEREVSVISGVEGSASAHEVQGAVMGGEALEGNPGVMCRGLLQCKAASLKPHRQRRRRPAEAHRFLFTNNRPGLYACFAELLRTRLPARSARCATAGAVGAAVLVSASAA